MPSQLRVLLVDDPTMDDLWQLLRPFEPRIHTQICQFAETKRQLKTGDYYHLLCLSAQGWRAFSVGDRQLIGRRVPLILIGPDEADEDELQLCRAALFTRQWVSPTQNLVRMAEMISLLSLGHTLESVLEHGGGGFQLTGQFQGFESPVQSTMGFPNPSPQKTQEEKTAPTQAPGVPLTQTAAGWPQSASKIRILFLSASPTDQARLCTDQEYREIWNRIRMGSQRDRFELVSMPAVRLIDASQILLDSNYDIVHFSGHGEHSGALYFVDNQGLSRPVPPDALAALFAEFSSYVKCVVLNACYSAKQAKVISHHIPYVVGMKKPILDSIAIDFGAAFYQALAAERTVDGAFRLATVHGITQGMKKADFVFLKRNDS